MERVIYIPGEGGQLWPLRCQHPQPPRGYFSFAGSFTAFKSTAVSGCGVRCEIRVGHYFRAS
ncbi:unnamed protein product [Sphenostylis stenocarpa]|uniref:Uncharacterized protein n=1 Tax=Sphenostylis stenocarpa TaxID=92480 RepID=A0AA86VX25_9FABA|nr:unnamed protein product [Sphenostylis stenocarpa]